jgi:oligosaccharide repeat unit polymerase
MNNDIFKKNKIKKVNFNNLLYSILFIFIGISSVILYELNISLNIELLKLLLVFNIILFGYIYLKNDYLNRIFHPIVILYFMLILFIYGRVMLDVFGFVKVEDSGFFSNNIIPEPLMNKTLLILLIFINGFSFGALVGNKRQNVYGNINFNKKIFNAGRICFVIGVIPALYIQYLIFDTVNELGYLAIFRGEIEVELPIILRLLSGFFRVGFILILISFPSKNETLKYIFIFSLFIVLNLLTGIRGYYMSFIIVLIWYWYSVRKFGKISLFKLILIVSLMILFAHLIASNRDSNLSMSSLLLISKFLYDQSSSFLTVVYGIEYSNQIGATSYLNLFDVLFNSRNLLQDKIDYQLNPVAKDLGHSLGSSIIQEHYLIGGGLGLFIFSIIWTLIIGKSYNKLVNYRFGIALLIIILPNIFFSPRARTFDFINQNIVIIPIILLLYIIITKLNFKKLK